MHITQYHSSAILYIYIYVCVCAYVYVAIKLNRKEKLGCLTHIHILNKKLSEYRFAYDSSIYRGQIAVLP